MDDYTEVLFPKDKVKAKMDELNVKKEDLEEQIQKYEKRRERYPDREFLKRRGEQIRKELNLYFQSEKSIEDMTYNERRRFFEWLFPLDTDQHGQLYRVFVRKLTEDAYSVMVNANITAGGSFMVGGEARDTLEKPRVNKKNNSVKHSLPCLI
jgi:hypothetical protein